jgi:hypothetical protein
MKEKPSCVVSLGIHGDIRSEQEVQTHDFCDGFEVVITFSRAKLL